MDQLIQQPESVNLAGTSVRASESRGGAISLWTFAYLILFGFATTLLFHRYGPESRRDWAVLLGITLIAAIPWTQRILVRCLSLLQRIALRPALAAGLVAVIPIAIAAAFATIVVPIPEAHDEHSYMLAADTFASGRLANPTHPMWRHFETMHVIQTPTYASKYQPGQGLVLALGQTVFQLPLAGVWVITGLACAALFWALRAWLPPRWALLGSILAGISPVLFDWNTCYWGGSLAMLGGALVLGAIPRIAAGATTWPAAALGAGAGILAITRPYEAVLLAALTLIGLAGASLFHGRRIAWARAGAIALLAAAPFAVFLLVYNNAVTGSPFRLPYAVHDATYTRTPHFIFQDLKPARPIAHKEMRAFHDGWEPQHWIRQQSLRGWLGDVRTKCVDLLESAAQPPLLAVGLVALPWALARRRPSTSPAIPHRTGHFWLLFAMVGLALFALSQFIVTWGLSSHYAAAFAVLWVALLVACFKALQRLRIGRFALGHAVLAALLGLAVVTTARAFPDYRKAKSGGWTRSRAALAEELAEGGGKHLLIVRYPAGHNIHMEWVYNAADIDRSPIIWAREMDARSNKELLSHFADRRAWLVEVQDQQGKLSPYPHAAAP